MLQNGDVCQGTILSKQPKRNGSSRNWVNAHVIGYEKPISINWEEVQWWYDLGDKESVAYFASVDKCDQAFIDVKQKAESESRISCHLPKD